MLRLGFIIGFLALLGILMSGLAAYRAYDQELTVNRIALARAIDVSSSLVQDRLTERELLARVSSGLFHSTSVTQADMLKPLRASIYAFKTDFVIAGWVARLQPGEVAEAERELAQAGLPKPDIRAFDDTPLTPDAIARPMNVLMDVEPRSAVALAFVGRAWGRQSALSAMLARATTSKKPAASDPVPLLRPDGPVGVVLAAPVLQEAGGAPAGFVTFSYELGSLMLPNDEMSLFAIALKDPRRAGEELVADHEGRVTARNEPARSADAALPVIRTVTFGGRDWQLVYYAKTNSEKRAMELAAVIGLLGLAFTVIICGLFGYVAYNNLRMSREIQARISFEHRLTAVIDELNHRVKNILAVIQSIVTRTLRHGADIDSVRDLLIGRIHAMSHVVSLLSESKWQGVKLKGLFEPRAIPHAERIDVSGPDISGSARAAQSLSLLFFELASHADEGLSLVGKHPTVVARWEVVGEGDEAMFYFRWEESNTSAATRREDSDFGRVLLDRVAPEALGGTSRRHFTDVSYVYELTAPMSTVVDLTEQQRTDRLSAPVHRGR